MKPIYSINATGLQLFSVIAHLCTKCSEVLKDRPFKYLNAVTMMEQQAPTFQTPTPQVVYSVTMIFEAENQQAIDDLVNEANEKAKPLRPA